MKRVAHEEPKPLSRLRHFPGTPTLSPPFSLVTLSRFGLTPFRSHLSLLTFGTKKGVSP